MTDAGDHGKLRKPKAVYNVNFEGEKGSLRPKHDYFMDDCYQESVG